VLGDMLELGDYEEEGHSLVGRRAAQVVDLLIAVGKRGAIIAREARVSGVPPESVHETATTAEAVAILRKRLTSGDIVLVKGSRSMHMEEIVEQIRL